MLKVADFVTPLRVALTLAVVCTRTPTVLITNVPVVEPALTVMEAGTLALPLSTDKATSVPPAGAGVPKLTVPVEELNPCTVVGETETFDRVAGGVKFSVADFELVPDVAAITTSRFDWT